MGLVTRACARDKQVEMLKISNLIKFLPNYLVSIIFDIIFAASLILKGGGNAINSAPRQ